MFGAQSLKWLVYGVSNGNNCAGGLQLGNRSERDHQDVAKKAQRIGLEWIQPGERQNKRAISKASEVEWVTIVSSAMLFWSETFWKSRPGQKRREEACSRKKIPSKRMDNLFESVDRKKPKRKQWEKIKTCEDWGEWLSGVHRQTLREWIIWQSWIPKETMRQEQELFTFGVCPGR